MTGWMDQVKRMGRTKQREDKLWLAYSGSGIGFLATGRRCEIRLHGDSTSIAPDASTHTARYALYVDGVRTADGMMDTPEKTLVAFDGAEERSAKVMLVKLSESAMSTLAVAEVCCDGRIEPLAERGKLIEFVGDSITCGYGVDTTAADQAFHTNNEDVTRAYAWLAADALDADRSMVSLSGYGVISGWTPDPERPSPEQLIPLYYEKCGFSYAESDGQHAQDWAWDFSGREPDAIVVNLGTNDASYTVDNEEKQLLFRARYLDFLKVIRARNPHARLLCVLGAMGDVLFPRVEEAVRALNEETGDCAQALRLEAIRPEEEGYAADFHPTPATHRRVAGAVAEKLRELLG